MNQGPSVTTLSQRAVVDNYSPQWSMAPTPAGYEDVPWVFAYTFPALNAGMDNYPKNSFPLDLDADAEFILRGIWVLPSPYDTMLPASSAMLARLRDPFGTALADDFQAFALLGTAANFAYGFQLNTVMESLGSPAPVEPEIHCPPGSCMAVDLMVVPGAFPGMGGGRLILYGVKRYRTCP